MSEGKIKEIDVFILMKALWFSRKQIIKCSIYGAVIGVILAISMPKRYTSVVKVAPEISSDPLKGSASALANMVGLGMNNSVDAINDDIYPEIVSSSPFLLEFADINVEVDNVQMSFSEYMLENQKQAWWGYIMKAPFKLITLTKDVFSDSKNDTLSIKNSAEIQYNYCNTLKRCLSVTKDKDLGVITVRTTFQDPDIARMINDSLLTKLQFYMNEYRTAKTKSNLMSSEKMLEEAKSNYYSVDEAYAAAVDRNQDLTSQSEKLKLDRLFNERSLAFQVYSQIATQVESDRMKLQETRPIAAVIEPPTTPIKASFPSKIVFMLGFAFLGGFIVSAKLIIKEIF